MRFDQRVYAPVDDADAMSARPSLAALIYPVISMCAPTTHGPSRKLLIGENASAEMERIHSPQFNVRDDAPPCFLVHAEDDKGVPVANSLEFRDALKARGVPAETHLFARGGHGFGDVGRADVSVCEE